MKYIVEEPATINKLKKFVSQPLISYIVKHSPKSKVIHIHYGPVGNKQYKVIPYYCKKEDKLIDNLDSLALMCMKGLRFIIYNNTYRNIPSDVANISIIKIYNSN